MPVRTTSEHYPSVGGFPPVKISDPLPTIIFAFHSPMIYATAAGV
jgi:hypothetical protein